MNETKVMSLRLPEELAAELAAVARVEEVSISETTRAAVYRYITARRADENFKKLLQQRLEETARLWNACSGSGSLEGCRPQDQRAVRSQPHRGAREEDRRATETAVLSPRLAAALF